MKNSDLLAGMYYLLYYAYSRHLARIVKYVTASFTSYQ
jgi:hypothetical protein